MASLINTLESLVANIRRMLLPPFKMNKIMQYNDYKFIYSIDSMRQSWPVGVTELAASGEQELNALLPFLASVTRQKKWVVLVSPPYAPHMVRLIQAGINPARFMVVQAKSAEGKSWAVQQALGSNRCGAVLFWSTSLETRQRLQFEAAAVQGNSSCISFIESFNCLINIKKAA